MTPDKPELLASLRTYYLANWKENYPNEASGPLYIFPGCRD